MHKRLNNRQIYTILLIICIVGFWLFDNFYTPESYSSKADDGLRTVFPKKYFPSSHTGNIIHHDHYSFSYNEAFEQAEWVAYRLFDVHLTNDDRERPDFIEDPKVKTKSADWRNYRGSGYDRGHLCPAGDRRFSELAYRETFYTSNISPQISDFNAGVWNELEKQVRIWCKEYGDIYVFTGGVLENGLKTIGDEDVAVPASYYKIVARVEDKDFYVIAFLIPHQGSIESYEQYVVTVDKVEEETGINFFQVLDQLPDMQKAESSINLVEWPFTAIR